MTRFPLKPTLLAAAIAAGAFAGAVSTASAHNAAMDGGPAQSQGASMQQRDRDDREGMHMQRRVERMQVRIAQRLAALKVKLQLTPAQEIAWDAFEQTMQPTSAQLQRRLSLRSQMKTLPTPQRIDRLRELRAERDAAMDKRFDATKTFYAQLSPEQQKAFDENALRGHGHGHGRHHGGAEQHHRGGVHGGDHDRGARHGG